MDEVDIWRSANLLIQQHGTGALVEASKRAVALMKAGDEQGAAVWRQIIVAINSMMQGKPAPGETTN